MAIFRISPILNALDGAERRIKVRDRNQHLVRARLLHVDAQESCPGIEERLAHLGNEGDQSDEGGELFFVADRERKQAEEGSACFRMTHQEALWRLIYVERVQ